MNLRPWFCWLVAGSVLFCPFAVLAEETTLVGPPPPPAEIIAAVPAPAAPAITPEATADAPAWLAPSKGPVFATGARSNGSLFLNLLALALLLALAGGAIYLRRRRGTLPSLERAQPVRVLSTVRVGPKAQVVVTDVSGRLLLLGVTDTSVRSLGFLPDEGVAPELEAETPDDADDEDFTGGYGRYAPPRPRHAEPNDPAGAAARFRSTLASAWAEREALARTTQTRQRAPDQAEVKNPSVAQLLASRTRDVVQSGPAENPTTRRGKKTTTARPIEAQVRGLVARQSR